MEEIKSNTIPEFPNTEQAALAILNIIQTAQNRITLISPFVNPTEAFFEILNKAASKGRQIVLVCIESKLKVEVKTRLLAINNLEILNHENVHAKCYYNEEVFLQTSLNISKYSEKNNIEMGNFIKRADNPNRYYEALAIPEMIVQDAISKINRSSDNSKPKNNYRIKSYNFDKLKLTLFKEVYGLKGICIRCHTTLDYLNGNYALCPTCFPKWNKYRDNNFGERYCHWCGESRFTSKRKPFCVDCFRNHREQIVARTKVYDEVDYRTMQPPSIPQPNNIVQTGSSFPPPIPATEPQEENNIRLKNETIVGQIQEQETKSSSKQSKPESAKEIIPRKSKIKYFVFTVVFVLALISCWLYWIKNSSIHHEKVLTKIITQYFQDIKKQPSQVSKYFADVVENYNGSKNISPLQVDVMKNQTSEEYMYRQSIIIPETFSSHKDSGGNTVVEFWINFKCYRKSKSQYETCKAHEEFIFNQDEKIISVQQIGTENLVFSFKDPG